MNLVFFSFKYRYRQKELNNFLYSRSYGKYFILNLGGPLRYLIAKLLIFLKIGKAISCDGRPLITDKSKGINFWMRGTVLNIPSNLRNLNNNYVTINNPILQEKKVFQIYPINIKKTKIQKNPKIIFISRIDTKTNIEEKNIWENFKEKLLQDFTLIDNKKIWEEIFPIDNQLTKFHLYRKLKLLLRFEIIKKIKAKYNDRLNLIGDDWGIFFNSSRSIYNTKEINEIYRGNICLDLGSMLGSNSLYSRSNQIIESGGLIIQSYQNDGKKIWEPLDNKILFKDFTELLILIDKLFSDNEYCSSLLEEIRENFNNSNKLIEKSLDTVFLR